MPWGYVQMIGFTEVLQLSGYSGYMVLRHSLSTVFTMPVGFICILQLFGLRKRLMQESGLRSLRRLA